MQRSARARRTHVEPAKTAARATWPHASRLLTRQNYLFGIINGVLSMNGRTLKAIFGVAPLTLLMISCGEKPKEPEVPAKPVGEAITLQSPLGLPPVPIPADNP